MEKRQVVLLIAAVSPVFGCGETAAKKLPPCLVTEIRAWCQGEVKQTTEARAAAGLPAQCVVPFVATKCVDKSQSSGFMEILAAIHNYAKAFYSAPGGWPPYIMVGDLAFWVDAPRKDLDGASICVMNGQPGNPWPTLPVVDLDAAKPKTPGLRHVPRPGDGHGPQPGPGAGGDGAGGSSSDSPDCALCLSQADCAGLSTSDCMVEHCGASCSTEDDTTMVCADDSTVGAGGSSPSTGSGTSTCSPSGSACGLSYPPCCSGGCIPDDLGSSTCQ